MSTLNKALLRNVEWPAQGNTSLHSMEVCLLLLILFCFNVNQAPVVQTLDSAIHWITQLVLLVFIRWIVIYPVDSAIHRLNNWGQKFCLCCVVELQFFSACSKGIAR